jgi:hypothetical protein
MLPITACVIALWLFNQTGIYSLGYTEYTGKLDKNLGWGGGLIDYPQNLLLMDQVYYSVLRMLNDGTLPWYPAGVLW